MSIRLATLLAALGLATPAAGQSVPSPFPSDVASLFRDDVAGTRPPFDADREGLALGNFRLRGDLGLTAAYDSNILNLPDITLPPELDGLVDIPLDDAVFLIDPKVRLDSRWQRHAFGVAASGRIARYADHGDFNDFETWNVAVRGRIDIGDATEIHADGATGREVEARGASGLVFVLGDPLSYREDHVGVGVSTRQGNVSASLSGGWLRRRYDPFRPLDGQSVPLDFRNIRVWSLTPQLGYALGPDLDLFVRGNLGFTRSLPSPERLEDLGIATRDADGYSVLAGVRGAITPLLVAEIAAGWQKRDFAAGSFADFDGLAYTATLDWYPTPLLSFRLRSRQDFENSGIPDVPGILARTTALTAYYEVTRALLVSGDIDWQYREYRATPVTTDSWALTARAEYRFSRHFSGALFVRYRDRSSNDSALLPPYQGTMVGLAFESRL